MTKLSWGIIAVVAVVALGLVAHNASNLFQDSINIALNTSQAATPHDYFNQLSARSDFAAGYSLRNPAQLQTRANGGFAYCNSCPLDVTYTYPNDPDPRQQDAAKAVVGTSNNNSLRNQLHIPIPNHNGQSLFVTWDGWFGKEWTYSTAGIPTYKTWQLTSPPDSIFTEIRNRFQAATAPNIAMVDGRLYNGAGSNITTLQPLAPQVGTFTIKPETWTRWFAFFEPNGTGFYEYSLWVADSFTAPVKIFDKLLIKPGTGEWEEWWLEFNTSTDIVKTGRPNLVAYVRNLAMLKGTSYTTAQSLLQQPGATGTLPPPPPPPPANVLPNVSLTSPTSGQTFTAPATVNLAATASDSDGTITKVEFFNGSTLLNSDTTSPYSFSWTNVAAGSYSITAKATDNAGGTKTSTAASITVSAITPPPPPPTSTLLPGDLNGDKIVNSIDWSIMNSKWLTSDPVADINKDGLVNSIDFSIMNSNWLKTSP